MQTLDRTSVLDSDENNNDSQQSSSISEVPNQVKFENEFYNVSHLFLPESQIQKSLGVCPRFWAQLLTCERL